MCLQVVISTRHEHTDATQELFEDLQHCANVFGFFKHFSCGDDIYFMNAALLSQYKNILDF